MDLALKYGVDSHISTTPVTGGQLLVDKTNSRLYVDLPNGSSTTRYKLSGDDISTDVAVTVAASGWSNNVYSFETTYPVASYDIEISLVDTATQAQANAWAAAQIVGSRTTNAITALGGAPTIDIPVMLTYRKV